MQGCRAVASFRSQLTSVTPIERTASATGVPCATSTSTWRSLDTISSGLCLFLDMGSVLLRLSRAIPQSLSGEFMRFEKLLRSGAS